MSSLGIMSPTVNEDVKRKHQVAIAEYFHHNRRRNSLYGLKFFSCEILNLVNCGFQIYLIDTLLGGEFSTYGLQVLHFATLDDEVLWNFTSTPSMILVSGTSRSNSTNLSKSDKMFLSELWSLRKYSEVCEQINLKIIIKRVVSMIDSTVSVSSLSTWSTTRSSSLSGSGSSYSSFCQVSTWFSGRNRTKIWPTLSLFST